MTHICVNSCLKQGIIIIIIIIIIIFFFFYCCYYSGRLYQTLYKNIVNLDSKYLTLQTLGKWYQ